MLHPIDNRSGVLVSRDKKDYIDFSSNDYFGYSQDPELLEKINQKKWTQFGATGSRLLGGDYQLIHEIEKPVQI